MSLTPQVKQAIWHDGKLIDVVCFDFMAQVKNLLTNDTLLSPQNVSFDFVNPCKAPQPTSVRSEFHTGTWWIDAHDFLVPLMFFVDKQDTHGRKRKVHIRACPNVTWYILDCLNVS